MTFRKCTWFRWSVLLLMSFYSVFAHTEPSEYEEKLETLSKQIKALLEFRKEDLQIIEDSLLRKLFKSPEISDVREEMRILRSDVENLRIGDLHKNQISQHPAQDKNQQLTIKWLSNAVVELKTELSEIQKNS
ncbi:hypothetical protein FQR65_LT18740 [Abscondita terminalis]|nr:hypothetical protein FQR65_LT18740 [Abscondita terminalis]